MQLSKNLSLKEVTKSQVAARLGISNQPDAKQIENLKLVATHVFQPIRDHFDVPIFVSSGFRSKELNKAIKGAKRSEHMSGMALDLDADTFGKVTNKQIFEYIKENLHFNQLIWEFGDDDSPDWVHVSYNKDNNTHSVLIAKQVNGSTIYQYAGYGSKKDVWRKGV